MSSENQEIIERMKQVGVRQVELAAAVGVDKSTMWRWLQTPLTTRQRRLINTALNRMEQEGAVI